MKLNRFCLFTLLFCVCMRVLVVTEIFVQSDILNFCIVYTKADIKQRLTKKWRIEVTGRSRILLFKLSIFGCCCFSYFRRLLLIFPFQCFYFASFSVVILSYLSFLSVSLRRMRMKCEMAKSLCNSQRKSNSDLKSFSLHLLFLSYRDSKVDDTH